MRQVKALLAISFSVFLLAMSLALVSGRFASSRDARADYEPAASGIVGFKQDDAFGCKLLMADGRVRHANPPNGIDPSYPFPPVYLNGLEPLTMPVPVSEIKFWSETFLVTQSNSVWAVASDPHTNVRSWVNLGAPPEIPVPGASSSVGDLKAGFGVRK